MNGIELVAQQAAHQPHFWQVGRRLPPSTSCIKANSRRLNVDLVVVVNSNKTKRQQTRMCCCCAAPVAMMNVSSSNNKEKEEKKAELLYDDYTTAI